ncbi:MAG: DUF4334 domain-containing protein [Pseudomonadota bacterium]
MAGSKIDMNKFEKIINKSGVLSCKELDELFAELEPITIDEMMGEWRLGYLFTEGTGSKFETLLRYLPIKLYGKRFLSKNKVQAWVFSLFGIKFGFPGATSILETIDYRGKISTSMIYNYIPMIDHFRKVDDSVIMGIMEIKGNLCLYFYLRR